MIDGHDSVTVQDFRGIWSAGEDESVPLGYFIDSRNLRYDYQKAFRRDGSVVDIATTFGVARMHTYNRTGEVSRKLLLATDGKLYDSAVSLLIPILNIPAMTDFSMVVIANRAYITPHNRVKGLPGESVYVYQGSGTARTAGGLPPSGFTLTVQTSSLSGVVEAGDRLFAVVYETDTGFITAPGPAIFTRYTATGNRGIDFHGIQTGPPGTIARHIICTAKLPTDFDGNQANVEYFFIPNGKIPNNTATDLFGVSFYDSELEDSADYLFDQLSTIPAGVGIGNYKGSMVVWGSNDADRTIHISKSGQPESIDAVDDILQIRDDGGGGVKNCIEFRDQLYIHKAQRSYVTQDNNDSPAFWTINSMDQSIGTEPFGIGQILDQTGMILDYYVIADRSGLRLMDGTFKTELTRNQTKLWGRITKSAFDQTQVTVDPIERLIYVAVALDGQIQPTHILVCDYQDGLFEDKVKWDIWEFPFYPKSITVDVDFTTKETVMKFANQVNNVIRIDPAANDDFGNAIPYYWRLGYFNFSKNDGISQFVGVLARVRGRGTLQMTIYGLDDTNPFVPTFPTLSATPGKPYQYKFDYVSHQASFKFAGGFNNADTAIVVKLKIFGSELWVEDPNP